MKSRTIYPFRKLFSALPKDVQQTARANYRLWKENPQHPSVRFERKKGSKNLYSARIGEHYRALAYVEHEIAKWFWIGSHADYDKLMKKLKAIAQGQERKARK